MNAFAKSELSALSIYQAKTASKSGRFLQSDPEFKRQDFQIYISNLSQRAGVPTEQIRQLVLKELADNALDEMDRVGQQGLVTITQDAEHTYTVTDQGRGFDDTPKELAKRFSLDKEMTSSKQWRKPTRGCVGNGLRVIVGSVVSGGGRIIVKTRNCQVTLRPRLDGTTAIEDVQTIDWPIGTAVTIEIDPKYHASKNALGWAKVAIKLAGNSGEPFARKPSPWWFDRDHLALNMLAAIGAEYTLAWFVGQLDRCSSREIGRFVAERFGKGRLCRDVNQAQAAELLSLLRSNVSAVIKPKQLGPMKCGAWSSDGYACEEGTFTSGRHEPFAQIPFLVEAWATTCKPQTDSDDDDVYPIDFTCFTINRSPAIVDYRAWRFGRSRDVSLYLGDTQCYLSVPTGAFRFALNITSPFIPILSDNKSPSLGWFKNTIVATVEAAIRRSARNSPPVLVSRSKEETDSDDDEGDEEKPERVTQRDAIWQVLPEAIKRSGEGGYAFSQRSLYYRVRILTKEIIPVESTYNYFCSVLTDYENDKGEIEKLIRDTRGVYVEPHGGELTQMGTVTVDGYVRPPWAYSNILFLEKEDLVSALRQSGFLDRWDCFALSSKGFSSRAARDLIDKIGASGKEEPTRFFCVHDADASGSLISQTLTKATKARAARTVEVIDLGFFPWTALAEGLLREAVERKSKTRRPVADYIKARDAANRDSGNPNNEPNWESWLQNWRVELNAMTTAEFVDWMNEQFIKHGAAKVVPAEPLALQSVSERVRASVSSTADAEVRNERREDLAALQRQMDELEIEIAEEAESRASERFKKIKLPTGSEVVAKIKVWLKKNNQSHWTSSIDAVASKLAKKGLA
jgi:hypothetical protein